MSNLIPFSATGAALPAHLKAAAATNVESAFSAGIGAGGFPVLSIKGKVFTVVENKERKMIMKPDDNDEPATKLEVVFVAANPNRGRVFYTTGFEDGSSEKPTCYSDDGVTPAADAQQKQCKTCAACPHAVKGSGQNGKGTACAVSRKTVVVAAGHLSTPMMLRVPNASTFGLADYDRSLRGVPMNGVVTMIKFDNEEATPKLQYKGVAYLSAEQFDEVNKLAKTDLVQQMLGMKPLPSPTDEDEFAAAAPAHLAAPKPEAKPKPKAVAAPVEEEEAPAPAPKPKAKVVAAPVEVEEEAPAPVVKPKAKAAPVTADDQNLLDELDDLLGSTDD